MESERIVLWIAFNVFVLGMLAVDLGVFHRHAHAVSIKEASIWSLVWIALALTFNFGVYFAWGEDKALEFLTGYVIEKSLSVDNLFVFLMIFRYFSVPAIYQHRILFWGIVGALIMRAIFIAAGAALLENFHWMIYLFGGFLIVTGIKMLLQGDEKLEPERNPVVRLFQRWVPMTHQYHDQRFFLRQDGKLKATLLMLVLVVVETTDVIFAVDSIPAIFAITRDPFIVYTSNVFAILGLRALYFLLAGVLEMFVYLKVGLSFVLCFVGMKMIVVDFYKIPIGVSLGVVGAILALSILASLLPQWIERRALRSPAAGGDGLRAPAFGSFLVLLISIGVIATLAKWQAIASGPSANEAIAVIRVVERELAQARRSDGATDTALLQRADATLEAAWLKLEQKRYDDAISAAHEASLLLGDLSRREP